MLSAVAIAGQGPSGPPGGRIADGNTRLVIGSDPAFLSEDDRLVLLADPTRVLLPPRSETGDQVTLKYIRSGAGHAAITIASAASAQIDGRSDLTFTVPGQAATLVYVEDFGWIIT